MQRVIWPREAGSQICFYVHKNFGRGVPRNPFSGRPDGPMSVCLTGGAAPTPCQRVGARNPRHARPAGCAWLRVAPLPASPPLTLCPPDFASRAGLQDALRLQPAPTICASTARAESGMLSGKPVLTTFDNTLFSLKGFNRCRELPKRAAACSVVRPRGDGRGQKRGDRCRPSRGPDARGVARSSHPPEHQSRTGWGAGADPRNHACGAGEDHAGPECPSGGRRGPPRAIRCPVAPEGRLNVSTRL